MLDEAELQELIDLIGKKVSGEIFRFCSMPKTNDEIISHLLVYYPKLGYKVPTKLEMRRRTANKLLALESAGAIKFDKDKETWKSTDLAMDIYQKYYGINLR